MLAIPLERLPQHYNDMSVCQLHSDNHTSIKNIYWCTAQLSLGKLTYFLIIYQDTSDVSTALQLNGLELIFTCFTSVLTFQSIYYTSIKYSVILSQTSFNRSVWVKDCSKN